MKQLTVKGKLGAARLMVSSSTPYLTSILFMLVPREAPGLGTIGCTENGIMVYDPEVIDKWTVQQLAGALAHEVMHFLQEHMTRFKDRNQVVGNIAGDLTINPAVKAMGYELPPDVVWPEAFGFPEKQTADWYYEALMAQAQQQQQGQGAGSGASGKKGKNKPQQGQGQNQKPGLGSGWCGSCAGNPLPDEPDGGDAQGRSKAELDRATKATAEAVRQAASQGVGNVPDDLARWASAQLAPPKVRWQDKLARRARASLNAKAGCTDYSYGRPSRRQSSLSPGDPIKPSMRAYEPKVAVWVDTSGSMGSDELGRAMAEVRGVMRAVGASITFGAIDCAIHAVKQVAKWQDALKALKGGGGTDFRPVFEWLTRQARKPDILIFVTDGQGPAPKHPPPSTHVIWLLVGKYRTVPCEWGEAIEIDD